MNNATKPPASAFANAARFWEPRRVIYNAILTIVVLLWVALTWPHFRPALTLGSLEAFIVLGLAANFCYSAAYLADLFMQSVLAASNHRRFRWALFIFGTLFAVLLENYWIGDEIYPYANQLPPAIIGGASTVPAAFASNMNFPAPLAVVGFLGAALGLVLGVAAVMIFWFARKANFARTLAIVIAAGTVVYLALLLGFSAASRTITLSRGEEKYFCEIDCHLAYSIANVQAQADSNATRYLIKLRTRFDESTTSPSRPNDATLTPSPREVWLLDSTGHTYTPTASEGAQLLTPLKPGDSYATQLEFTVPKDATGLRLLLRTKPAWPDHFVIGDENSLLHKKTYFAL
jgi:hypothetical protein